MDGQWFPGGAQTIQFEGGYPRNPWLGKDFYESLADLGLTTGLKLCLDAGDGTSYTGSGQTWADLSGNGDDFDLGATSSSEASDPTFNGSSGALSSAEYFSHDGADYFTDQATAAWVDTIHKAGSQCSFAMWVNLASNSTVFGNSATSGTVGFRCQTTPGGALTWVVTNGSSTILVQTSAITVSFGAWTMIGLSFDEAAGVGGLRYFINGSTETESGSAALVSPSAAAASNTLKIGAGGSPGSIVPNGTRFGGFMAWQGLTLSQDQFAGIFAAQRWRYGV